MRRPAIPICRHSGSWCLMILHGMPVVSTSQMKKAEPALRRHHKARLFHKAGVVSKTYLSREAPRGDSVCKWGCLVVRTEGVPCRQCLCFSLFFLSQPPPAWQLSSSFLWQLSCQPSTENWVFRNIRYLLRKSSWDRGTSVNSTCTENVCEKHTLA